MSQFNLDEVVQKFKASKIELDVIQKIKSGKEAVVYKVSWDDRLAALKLYKDPEQRAFKNTHAYVLGKYVKKPSHRKALSKKNRFGKQLAHQNWVKREFYLLKKLYGLGCDIPEPYRNIENAILMEYIGDKKIAAPRLRDIKLTKKQARKIFEIILKNIRLFLDAGIVHSDLSAFNILWWQDRVYIIDFPQAVDVRTSPKVEEFLKRDIMNVYSYLGKFIDVNVDEVWRGVKTSINV